MKYTLTFAAITATIALTSLHFTAKADVALNPMFGDHMVLQRERPLPIWGKADPGEKVSVSFAGLTQSTTASPDGKWMVFFEPMPVSNQPRVLTAKARMKSPCLTCWLAMSGWGWASPTWISKWPFLLWTSCRI
jgi:hypothetical protein